MPAQTGYQCNLCDRQFKREDHLQRHKLSHGKAQFQCSHGDCGMTFHRKDVLQRHEKVHEPNPSVRRRRPRRGVNPKPFVRSSITSTTTSSQGSPDNGQPHDSQNDSPASTLGTSSWRSDDDVFQDIPYDALEFCSTHFRQSCIRRFAFIHNTSLDRNMMPPETLLAMGALGGCSIPEYHTASRSFFIRACQVVEQRKENDCWIQAQNGAERLTTTDWEDNLKFLQTYIMLIEYGLWSPYVADQQWAVNCSIQLASRFVPNIIVYVKTLAGYRVEWIPWTHHEQAIRTLWAFYCTTQKAKILMKFSHSTLEHQRDLPLPGPDSIFEAEDESSWKQRTIVTLNGPERPTPAFSSAFFALMSNDGQEEYLLEHITPLGRHVLLAALLDQYHNALLLPSNFETSDAYHSRDLDLFKPRSSFIQALKKWRRLWWVDTSILFSARPPRSAELQNVLLLNYLEITLLETEPDEIESVCPGDKHPLEVTSDVFCAVIKDNLLEVATQAPWVVDRASRFFVTECARYMMRWVNQLKDPEGDHRLGSYDREIYIRCCDSLQVYAKDCFDSELYLDPSDLRIFEDSLFDAWSIIVTRRDWLVNCL